jgi:hypothetical protein
MLGPHIDRRAGDSACGVVNMTMAKIGAYFGGQLADYQRKFPAFIEI